MWVDRTDAIVGRAGARGPQSRMVVYAYINTATAPTVAPTGGTFVQSTGAKTVPTGYTVAPVSPPTTQETYRAEAIVNPANDTDTVTLVWSIPALLPAYAAATLAEEFAEEAEAARDLAQQYAGQAQDIPAGSPRGDLVATSPTLPTAATGSNTVIAFGATELWTLTTAGTAADYAAGEVASNERLYLPDIHPAGSNGMLVVVEVGGVEIAEVFISQGGIQGATGADRRLILPVSLTANALVRIGFWPRSGATASYIQITGNSDTLSADTVIKVYLAVVRGDSGGGGGGGGASLSDDTPEDVGTAAAGTGTEASRDDHVHGGETGAGTTNLGIDNRDADSLDVTSSTGTDATVPSASTTQAGLQSSTDKVKLDGIETEATADQTDTEIKTAYENNTDTNAFTDALQTKLNGIDTGATDVTIQDVLDQIMAGTNVTIDDATAGQITIASSGGGGGGGGFTLHSGAGAPANSLGADDDWYLNTTDGAWFEKSGGSWGSAVYTDQLGEAGTLDGVVNSMTIAADGTVTLGRSIGADVTHDFSTALALLTGATFTGAVNGVTPADDDNSTQFATTEFVADGFHGASFSNFSRHLTLSRLGGGTAASLPLTYLNAFQGIDPTGSNTYHGGDSVKVSGNIYMYTANVSASVATADVPTDNRFDLLTGGAVSTAHDLYAGWSTDTTVTAAEVLLGADTDTDTLTLPTGTGNQYLWVWRADEDGGDPSEVHIAGGGNQRNTFGPASALTVSSIAGQLIVTITTQNVSLLGGESIRVV